MSKKDHWENIYETKNLQEVSWYQKEPITAINYLKELNIEKSAAIIDVGGGDGFLVDYLIQNEFSDITVLDISAKALERAKQRLGPKAHSVNWIVADASNFKSEKKFDFWYDRAAFHFLTGADDIKSYVTNLAFNISDNGKIVIGTFSEQGPKKCSGIEIKQYSANSLEQVLADDFKCTSCLNVDHPTPFNTVQNFTFCSFIKKE